MNIERLNKIAEFLDKLGPENFDLQNFVTSFDIDNHCNSVCCAVGWFPAIFPEDFDWDYEGLTEYEIEEPDGVSICSKTLMLTIGWTMAQKYLDLSEDQAHLLFSHEYYTDYYDPSIVTERVRDFIKKGGSADLSLYDNIPEGFSHDKRY